MDLLLSLPILPYLLSPGASSWSTSLNLIFFYLTWSTLVLSHPPLKIQLLGLAAIRVGLWLVPSLLFLAFDCLVPSLAEGIKVKASSRGRRAASSLPPSDIRTLSRTLALALINLALVVAVEGLVSYGITTLFLGGSPVFRTATTLPLPWGMARQLAVLFAGREILTYAIHRFVLHSKSSSSSGSRLALAPRLTAVHVRYAHSSPGSPPYSLLLFADHPLPLILHVWLPIYLPAAALVRPHLLTYFLFLALCTVEQTATHSGYSVVPGIILGGMARRCSTHYSSHGRGNYGAWGLLDWMAGTSVGPGADFADDVVEEAEKHRLKERGERRVNEGAGLLQQGLQHGLDIVREQSAGGRSPSARRSGRTRKAKAA